MSMSRLSGARGAETGTTLLEVLVAVFVLALGLLGVAGLQLLGLKGTQTSAQRTAATLVAGDIADRMRANRVAVESGDYNAGVVDTVAVAPADCYLVACTPAQQAQHDVLMWARSVNDMTIADPKVRLAQGRLPNGRVAVCFDSTPDDGIPAAPACDNLLGAPYVIKVWWDERAQNVAESGSGSSAKTRGLTEIDASVVQQRFVTSFLP